MTDQLSDKRWQMNPTASSFSTDFAPEIETRLYEAVEGGYTLTVSGTWKGRPYAWNYTALYDGKPRPVFGRQDVDSITIHRIDDLTTIGFFMKQLTPGGQYARHLSEDGKSLVVEAAGRNPDGQPFYDVIEYSAD